MCTYTTARCRLPGLWDLQGLSAPMTLHRVPLECVEEDLHLISAQLRLARGRTRSRVHLGRNSDARADVGDQAACRCALVLSTLGARGVDPMTQCAAHG